MREVNRSVAILGLVFKAYSMPEFADAMMHMAAEYAQSDEDFTAIEIAAMLSTAGLPAAIPLGTGPGIPEDVQQLCDEGYLTLALLSSDDLDDPAHWGVVERDGLMGRRVITCKRVIDGPPDYADGSVDFVGPCVVIGQKCPAMQWEKSASR